MTRRKSTGRPVARRIAGIGVGVLAVAVTGALAAVGGALPVPAGVTAGLTAATGSDVRQVTVPPADQLLVCPGPARLTDPATVGDDEFEAAPVETETSLRAAMLVGGGATAALSDLLGDGPRDLADGPDAAVLTEDEVTAGSVLRTRPGTAPEVLAAAAAGSITTDGDLRGLAAASCAAPRISHWLVGGSTEIGSSTQLVLQNPGRTPATVRASMWGPGGPVTLTGGGQYLVAPGEEIVVLVEASAPEQRRLVVNLEAEGGLVAAYLQHSTLDGLRPLGVDLVVPGAAPTTSLAVPGVVSTGEGVDDADAPQLRLLAPTDDDAATDDDGAADDAAGHDAVVDEGAAGVGDADDGASSDERGTDQDAAGESGPGPSDLDPRDTDASSAEGREAVTISVYGADGLVRLRGAEVVELTPGVVSDVSLGGLPPGRYTVAVESAVPVVAGAVVSRVGDQDPEVLVDGRPVDRAWIASTAVETGGDAEQTVGRSQVALLPGTRSEVVVGAVPLPTGPPDGAEVDGAAGVDGAGTDESGIGAAGTLRGTLRAYDEAGEVVGTRDLAVPAGTTSTVLAADLADGDEPATVTLEVTGPGAATGAGAVRAVWSVVAEAGPEVTQPVDRGDAPDDTSGDTGGEEADETADESDAADGPGRGLISVLLPVPGAPGLDTVDVRATETAGLG
ncbi:DUF5719 family protein [Oerskovia flava]|uniref:DUF5719 family protein n=1 Tax=Oerskovia flava TaxID=2986422 RepID=UPI00223EAA0C|nr:DUF5719 family protein [Oerskovia sp. JB1-3-2]